jgi:hypothetical protein
MQFAVTVQLTPHPSLWSECYLYAGACALAHAGHIALQFRTEAHAGSPNLVLLDVTAVSTGQRKCLAFDLYDRADLFNPYLLERADIYYKRSYHQPLVIAGAKEHHEKVHPFGLPFPCHLAGSKRKLFRRLILPYISHFIDTPGHSTGRMRDDYQILRQFLASPSLEHFVEFPTTPKDPVIAFQTRLWEPTDTTDDADAVNNERVGVVRALKKEFGSRFHGGVVPTAYARANFPDALTPGECKRSVYIAQAKRSLIGVYTRGLHHSIAYKFPEYLAASQCIVSTPLRNQLAAPLDPDVHYLPFGSSDDCVAQCVRVLENRELASNMRQANHTYFLNHVHPAPVLSHAIKEAFSPAPSVLPMVATQK